jgi:hypothetical protein
MNTERLIDSQKIQGELFSWGVNFETFDISTGMLLSEGGCPRRLIPDATLEEDSHKRE